MTRLVVFADCFVVDTFELVFTAGTPKRYVLPFVLYFIGVISKTEVRTESAKFIIMVDGPKIMS